MGQIELFAIGASAGGISALREIARALPADLPAALCVVVHVAADSPGILPAILDKSGPLPASHPRDGEDIRPGHIYVAPPDHHLIVESAGRLRLGRGPKENRVRPAVDPLFRSAALAYGPRAAGVVLSGGLVDGTAGLLEIKRAGGLALVQDPREAESPSMPRSALRHVEVDHCLALNALGRCIAALASAPAPPQSSEIAMPRHLETEVAIATGVDAVAAGVAQLGAPSMLTCPDCHGVLLRIDDDRLVRFRCHTGHAFNGESLVAAQSDASEEALWSAVRALREHEFLLRELAKEHEAQGDPQAAAHARARSEHIEGLARAIREAAEELSSIGVPRPGAERRGQASMNGVPLCARAAKLRHESPDVSRPLRGRGSRPVSQTRPDNEDTAQVPTLNPIVGVGASAGGVRVLQELFGALPSNLGAAYVVVVHLDPKHQSELSAVLQTRTRMPVRQVGAATPMQPNSVYVIPPDKQLLINDTEIATADFDEPRGRRSPIDLFFRSLAEQHGDGFAVVLTGAGSDGSAGIKAVKECGGIVLVQDPAEAEYASMPHSAVATGVADFVLPVRQIAAKLAELIPLKKRLQPELIAETEEDVLRRIFAHVRTKTGHDFSKYKRSTLSRRLTRRMQVNRIERLEDYTRFLAENAEEVQALLGDLLISVTSFFRDCAAFQELADSAIPKLFQGKDSNDTIRVWVPGCATGEEAYSIAMLLLEEAGKHERWPHLQVFASDIDLGALATARHGRYPAAIAADVSDERRRRFFIEEDGHFRIKRELRDVVLFASHSLLKDPPFSKLDLICCRNLLIYLDRELQQQACATFHYALNSGGFLFLGASESADAPPGLFRMVNRDARIYQAEEIKKINAVVPKLAFSPRPMRESRAQAPASIASGEAGAHHRALEEAAPPSVLVDERYRAVHLSESAGRFLQHPAGPLVADLTEIVRSELRVSLRTMLGRVFDDGKPALGVPIPVRFNGTPREVILQVRPVLREGGQRMALVFFLEGGEAASPAADDGGGAESQSAQYRQLRRELDLTRARLQTSREEFELATEELRAANEELESINEEYRSTAEELETSKEELQSINEELQTVNAELKQKLESVARAHADLQNLITATDVGTLFLDSGMRIRRFTPRIVDLFNITASDEGRPITDFTHRLAYRNLVEDARTVLSNLVPVEHEVQSDTGHWYLVRLRPYRTDEDHIDGVVVTFVDITKRRAAEEALRNSETRLQLATEAAGLGIYDYDPAVQALWLDQRSRWLLGFTADEAVGLEELRKRVHPDDEAPVRSAIELALESAAGGAYGIEFRLAGDGQRWVRAQGQVFQPGGSAVFRSTRLVGTVQDITERKHTETRQRLLLQELSHRVKNTLAIVMSLARQTLRSEGGVPQLLARFEGRLQALSAAHDILVESDWRGADFLSLARRQLQVLVADMSRVEFEGPPLELPESLATPIGLLLHELATNAIKHGALSNEQGRVRLAWDVLPREQRSVLELCWREEGGPPVKPSATRGFGSAIIERSIPRAEVRREFRREGAACQISVPLPESVQAHPARLTALEDDGI